MIKILCLAVLCLTAVAGFPKKERIINGSPVTIEQYPFMAGILYCEDVVGFLHMCGGTIINNRSILTASHCIFNVPVARMGIRVGSALANNGGYVHNVATVITYPEYNPITYEDDIGIVRVATAFSFGAKVQVARIAGPNYYPAYNDAAWAVGWGRTETSLTSEDLLHVQISIFNQTLCEIMYESHVNPRTICAGGAGSGICFGDSGGPLVHNNVLVGVVSLTYAQCGIKPSIFARVSSYANWIQQNA